MSSIRRHSSAERSVTLASFLPDASHGVSANGNRCGAHAFRLPDQAGPTRTRARRAAAAAAAGPMIRQ